MIATDIQTTQHIRFTHPNHPNRRAAMTVTHIAPSQNGLYVWVTGYRLRVADGTKITSKMNGLPYVIPVTHLLANDTPVEVIG